jgi:hypothetical protein
VGAHRAVVDEDVWHWQAWEFYRQKISVSDGNLFSFDSRLCRCKCCIVLSEGWMSSNLSEPSGTRSTVGNLRLVAVRHLTFVFFASLSACSLVALCLSLVPCTNMQSASERSLADVELGQRVVAFFLGFLASSLFASSPSPCRSLLALAPPLSLMGVLCRLHCLL